MSRLVFLLLVAVPATLCMKEMREYLDMWNWDAACWGEANVESFIKMEKSMIQECLATPVDGSLQSSRIAMPVRKSFQPAQPLRSAFTMPSVPVYNTYPFINSMYSPYGRKKRSSDMEYIDAQELKDLWTAKVSNLTCFMKGMGVIDDQYNIQMDFLKTGVWQMKDLTATEHLSDPVWREKMSQSWCDCAEIAQAMPESVLDNCPIARMFGPMGRSMKFLMCKKVRLLLKYFLFYLTEIFSDAHREELRHGSGREASEV